MLPDKKCFTLTLAEFDAIRDKIDWTTKFISFRLGGYRYEVLKDSKPLGWGRYKVFYHFSRWVLTDKVNPFTGEVFQSWDNV